MLEAAEDALIFVAGCSHEDFAGNRMMQNAVIRAIEVIGEAGSHISQEYRTAHPEIPWRDIIGMRNHLIHAYFDIDIPLTWRTVVEDLPPFIALLDDLIQKKARSHFAFQRHNRCSYGFLFSGSARAPSRACNENSIRGDYKLSTTRAPRASGAIM